MDGGRDYTRGRDQDHPQKKKSKKAKWLSEKALQIAEKGREEDKTVWHQCCDGHKLQ